MKRIFTVLLAIHSLAAASPNGGDILWYDKPAADWNTALPTAWKDGTITGLLASGGFKIDIAWRNGKIIKAMITSETGGNARIRADGKITTINLPPGGGHIINL